MKLAAARAAKASGEAPAAGSNWTTTPIAPSAEEKARAAHVAGQVAAEKESPLDAAKRKFKDAHERIRSGRGLERPGAKEQAQREFDAAERELGNQENLAEARSGKPAASGAEQKGAAPTTQPSASAPAKAGSPKIAAGNVDPGLQAVETAKDFHEELGRQQPASAKPTPKPSLAANAQANIERIGKVRDPASQEMGHTPHEPQSPTLKAFPVTVLRAATPESDMGRFRARTGRAITQIGQEQPAPAKPAPKPSLAPQIMKRRAARGMTTGERQKEAERLRGELPKDRAYRERMRAESAPAAVAPVSGGAPQEEVPVEIATNLPARLSSTPAETSRSSVISKATERRELRAASDHCWGRCPRDRAQGGRDPESGSLASVFATLDW